ncbi:MAG: hypothetical protein QXX19_07205 [Candidatus Caldarchaeum sp.]
MKFQLISGGALKDAGLGFAGYYVQKLGHEKLIEPFLLQNLGGLTGGDPTIAQIVLNVIGVAFTSPLVGSVFGGNLVTIGGAIWHFARGLRLVLQKAGVNISEPFVPIPY